MQRKLTVILSADVVGYSSLMERDEAGTLARLKENRVAVFDPQVASHGGRQFKLMGDGALVEFGSVVAAVNCALAIQAATEAAEGLRYRIGINLGEVIIEGDDIYGEGVNVAARIQALAPVGGVALSKMVRDNVDGKMPCAFEDMGEHSVKNIERPVHVFSARAAGNEMETIKVDAPRKLSVCVLPFSNMSDDPQQEYFSDGISEDIITDLSKVSALFLIARHTAFQFKGKSIDVPQIARQLKVSHVLEGSVRKAGGRVRITAQLIDGATGGHVWAERYDRDLNDVFALQDEISEAIVKALKLKLLPEEKRAIEQRGTNSVEAYNLFQTARYIYLSGGVGTQRRADAVRRLCNGATKIDPNYAQAWGLMALAITVRAFATGGSGEEGLAAAERALALDPSLPEPHAAKARVLAIHGDFAGAMIAVKEALRLDPQSFEANIAASFVSSLAFQFNDAIPYLMKAKEIVESSLMPFGLLLGIYVTIGDKGLARQYAELTLARTQPVLATEPDNGMAMGLAAMALGVLGHSDRAREIVSRGLLLDPDNEIMKFFFLRAYAVLRDADAALSLLEELSKGTLAVRRFAMLKMMPDFAFIRDDPRFAAAEARLAGSS